MACHPRADSGDDPVRDGVRPPGPVGHRRLPFRARSEYDDLVAGPGDVVTPSQVAPEASAVVATCTAPWPKPSALTTAITSAVVAPANSAVLCATASRCTTACACGVAIGLAAAVAEIIGTCGGWRSPFPAARAR